MFIYEIVNFFFLTRIKNYLVIFNFNNSNIYESYGSNGNLFFWPSNQVYALLLFMKPNVNSSTDLLHIIIFLHFLLRSSVN